ncbi:MAG: hypothetical protein QW275_03260 [Candidatus Anstonellaceae archaeon]
MKGISEKDRKAIFAVLALLAIALAAYVLLFQPNPDAPSQDGREFYFLLSNSDKVAFLYDVRDASEEQASAIYQCGVDIISKGRLAGKLVTNIGCSQEGCIAAKSEGNGTRRMGYEQALKEASSQPYFLIKAGEPGYKFFEKHMEITIGSTVEGSTCDIFATEE